MTTFGAPAYNGNSIPALGGFLMPGDLPGVYFDPDPPTPAPSPAPTPPAPTPPAPTPPTPPVPPAPPERKEEPKETPAEKALREANERIARLEEQNIKASRRAIAAEIGIKPEAVEFITASDEAGIRAQAEKLKGLMPVTEEKSAVPPPAGTNTNPAGAPPADLEAKIAQAEKDGNVLQAIRLKRQAAGR